MQPRNASAAFAEVLQEGGHRQQGLRLPLQQNQQEQVDAPHAKPKGLLESFFRKIMPNSHQMQEQELQQGLLALPSQIGSSPTDPMMPSIASSSSAYSVTSKLPTISTRWTNPICLFEKYFFKFYSWIFRSKCQLVLSKTFNSI